ncbi:MAG: hypothetical protein DYG89_06175 [Caldilinea sp. CFX5]|nr:hypothetical protein [Caldilinea sp. CFX5]
MFPSAPKRRWACLNIENDIRITRTERYPLEKLTVPVLVVHGTADRLVQYDIHANTYARRVPQVEVLTVEGGEHVAIFTHRNLVRSKVIAFMAEHFNHERALQSV